MTAPTGSGGGTASDGGLTVADCAARLERLPLRGIGLKIVLISAAAQFFDIGDQVNLSVSAPTLRQVMGLTPTGLAVATAGAFLGAFLGAALGGYLSDRWGRLTMLRWTLVAASLLTVAQAAAQDPVQLIVIRTLAGVGIGSMFVVAVTYLIEMSPVSMRARRSAIAAIIGVAGPSAIATVARFVIPLGPDGWRLVFLAGGLGLLLLLPMKSVPESPLWLLAQGRNAEAEVALGRLERSSGTDLPEPARTESPEPEDLTAGHSGWRQLFRGRLLAPTLLLTTSWVLYGLMSQGFTLWLPTILDLRGFGSTLLLTITAVSMYGSPLGAFLAYAGARYLSRWVCLLTLCVIGCASVAAFFLVPTTAAVLAGAFGLQLVAGAFSPLINVTTAEEFPAGVRAGGSGFVYSMNKAVNIVAPFGLAAMVVAGGLGVGWFLAGGWALQFLTVTALRLRRSAAAARATPSEPAVMQYR